MKLILLIHFNQSIARLDKHIQKYIGKGSGCIIDSVIEHTISISKYNLLLARSNYVKLPK